MTQPPYGQPPYGMPPYGMPAPDHPRATTALVLGILGIVLCSVCAPFAWVIGGNAVKEIDASGGTVGGRGQAQAGRIMGIVGTAIMVLGVLFVVAAVILGLAVGSSTTS